MSEEYGLVKGIKTGSFTVLDSGIVILEGAGKSVTFEIDDVTVEIRFISDLSNPKVRINYLAKTEKEIVIEGVNFDDSSLGRGNPEPEAIIDRGGEKIYIRFIAFALINLIRVVYTFYKRAE